MFDIKKFQSNLQSIRQKTGFSIEKFSQQLELDPRVLRVLEACAQEGGPSLGALPDLQLFIKLAGITQIAALEHAAISSFKDAEKELTKHLLQAGALADRQPDFSVWMARLEEASEQDELEDLITSLFDSLAINFEVRVYCNLLLRIKWAIKGRNDHPLDDIELV